MSEMIYAPQFMSTALPCVASNILDFPTSIYIQLFGGV